MPQQYISELTPLFLAPFSAEQPAKAGEEQRQIFRSHFAEMKDHSLVAVWRFAIAKKTTRNVREAK